MKKILLIVMDGLGDRPNPELGGRTALEAAYRPSLNYLAAHGINGFMFPVKEGIRSGSDTSHLSILGYNTFSVYTGRGPFEAMGLGMDVMPGDIAFRANFAYVNDDGIVEDRRAGRISDSTEELCKAISVEIDGVQFTVKNGVEHRAALVMHGEGLSDRISDSDPHVIGRAPEMIKALVPEAGFTAEVLNKYLEMTRKVLNSHGYNRSRRNSGNLPANELLLRGAGKAPVLENFQQKYRLKAACVVGIPLISGICKLAGIEVVKYKGSTGTVKTDYSGKIAAALKALETRDFVLVNIKAPDIAGHDGNALLKRDVIQESDRAFSKIIPRLGGLVVAITGDHSTPCSIKEHSGDPVPIVVAGNAMRTDGITRFDETSAVSGTLRLKSTDLMDVLMSASDRSEKYGA
jgi:2,3-bisphosphoglycerate-independent phosphoglycerate mutase